MTHGKSLPRGWKGASVGWQGWLFHLKQCQLVAWSPNWKVKMGNGWHLQSAKWEHLNIRSSLAIRANAMLNFQSMWTFKNDIWMEVYPNSCWRESLVVRTTSYLVLITPRGNGQLPEVHIAVWGFRFRWTTMLREENVSRQFWFIANIYQVLGNCQELCRAFFIYHPIHSSWLLCAVAVSISIVMLRKLRHREAQKLAQGHVAYYCQSHTAKLS